MAQVAKPSGLVGKITARGMAFGHRPFYNAVAKEINFTSDDIYLEIGFGSGMFINKYAKQIKKIVGIDYSPDMVKLASSINKKRVKSGCATFMQGNASSLPFNDSEFTVVAAIETFFFWPEPESSLREIYRVLRPGWRLIIEMSYNSDDGIDHENYMRKINARMYRGEELRKLLIESGLREITIAYYKAIFIPFKGYLVPRGMVIKGYK